MSGAQVPALQTQARRFQGARVPAGCEVGRTCRTALLSSHGARLPWHAAVQVHDVHDKGRHDWRPCQKKLPAGTKPQAVPDKGSHSQTPTTQAWAWAWPAAGSQSDAFRFNPCCFPPRPVSRRITSLVSCPGITLVTGSARWHAQQGLVWDEFVPCGKSLPCLRPSFLP